MKKHTISSIICTTALLLSSFSSLKAQDIMATWIGGTSSGYTGDGGPATMAVINQPYGVCFDSVGNFYFTDEGNSAIRKVSATTGVITTIAGNGALGFAGFGGPASSAVIGQPYCICIDGSGNIYFSDGYNSVVCEISAATGIIKILAGNGSVGYFGDGGPAISAELGLPEGLCISAGNLYIADHLDHCIRCVNLSTGIISTIAGTGTPGYAGDGGAATAALLYCPSSVCADPSGNLYFADEENVVIRKISSGTGIISTIAGNNIYGVTGDGGPATNAEMGYIQGICMDRYNNIYINDAGCSCRKIDMATGIINTVAGNDFINGYSGDGGPATSELLNDPAGLCIDPSSGSIIIADYSNNRIRKVTQPGYFSGLKTNNLSLQSNIIVYPNPSLGIFTIQVPDNEKYSVAEIFNIAGEKVYTSLLAATNTLVDLSAMPGGTYVVSVQSPDGAKINKHVVIDR
jgi:hypothetical protein